MANEASISELSGANPVRFAYNPALNCSKGTLMVISGDLGVKKSSDGATRQAYAGVAAADHKAADAETSIAVYVPGQGNVFDMKCTSFGAIVGALVKISGTNEICSAGHTGTKTLDLSNGSIVGRALETGSANEVIRVLS